VCVRCQFGCQRAHSAWAHAAWKTSHLWEDLSTGLLRRMLLVRAGRLSMTSSSRRRCDAFAQTQEADFGQEEGYLPQCRANCRAEDFRGHTQALHEDDRGQVSLRGVCLVVIVSCGVRAVSLSVCLRVDARRSKHRSHLMGGYIMNVGAASVVLVDCLDVAGLCKLVLLARAVEVVIESHCSPLLNCVLMIEPCHFLWPMEVI